VTSENLGTKLILNWASSPPGLHQQAGHTTASDLCAARLCQAGARNALSSCPVQNGFQVAVGVNLR
jgi:hypothetical protein